MFHILLSCDSQGSMEYIYVCMYVCTTTNTLIKEHQHSARVSRRLKRTPVTRHEDFLW